MLAEELFYHTAPEVSLLHSQDPFSFRAIPHLAYTCQMSPTSLTSSLSSLE